MAYTDTSIIVVDDARFSSVMIHRVIKSAGYTDVRQANSASAALQLLEERPASIVIADWLMPEMDGLALTQSVRQLDEANNHFTYILLLTAREGGEALQHAFEQGVDDFLNKSLMNEQLLPRLWAGERLSALHNRLLRENQSLIEANAKLKKLSSLDALTGLGNRSYAITRLGDTIRHCASRGGACCYLLITMTQLESLRKQHSAQVISQLIVASARRLRQLVRPLDIVARIAPHQFAVITHQPSIDHCNVQSYRRLHESLNLKAYKTTGGFLSLKTTLNIVASDAALEPPSPEDLMKLAESRLQAAHTTGLITCDHWQAS